MWPKRLLPTSDTLVNKVQKISFIIFKTISHLTGHLNITIIFYNLSFYSRKGWAVRYPGLGSLPRGREDTLAWAACPPTHANVAN